MSAGLLSLIVLAVAVAGFFIGRARAVALSEGDTRKLHSLPQYHGLTVALLAAVPAFLIMLVWLIVQPMAIESRIGAMLPASLSSDTAAQQLAMGDVRRIADGLDLAVQQRRIEPGVLADMRAEVVDVRALLAEAGVALGSDVQPEVFEAAKRYREMNATGFSGRMIAVLAAALAGFAFAYRRIGVAYRARNFSEAFMVSLLGAASTIAILTTLGIVLSLVFETAHFFSLYPAAQFFFGSVWNPQFRGGSDLGILPLLWGTLYISFIALLVAVPIGLLSAIYLSEYASKRVRTIVKPLIEVLAGIPTIVYGLFALITVGPILRDYFAQPLGLGSSSSSVMTAGVVMGIMIIPFVSSLSDDIINAVPQSLRDGSLGLGATPSETIRRVVLPAALPGVVGAILLAASRAIGETMIVVMGAGAAAKLSMNPFEAMTTVTVKIVSQLTGDTEFASPETLVAFALGLTLFVVTLGLNVLALYIVRKYREQYE
jgi:phosphate transport system permease protein